MSASTTTPGRTERWVGLLLFLPVPVVLVLFTRMPLGALPSLALGVAIMVTHPLYARPWALRRAERRCLWCGGSAARRDAPSILSVVDPRGRVEWGCCSESHRGRALDALARAWRLRRLLRAGILGAIAVLLGAGAPAALGLLGAITVNDASAVFRFAVAFAVLPLGWSAGWRGSSEPRAEPCAPFPIHLGALIGLHPVLWLFRVIGLLWLAQGGWHLTRRIAGG
jgi:hypothetical protein